MTAAKTAMPEGGRGQPRQFEPDAPTLVFTDLDGTLLDHYSYSPADALKAIALLESRAVPIIMTTSKTAEEVVAYQQLLARPQPFITENGGVICVPEGFVPGLKADASLDGFLLQVFPPAQADIVPVIDRLKQELGLRFEGFHEHDADWVAEVTGLTAEQARRARRRYSSVPLQWLDNEEKLEHFRDALAGHGLRLLKGGRFYHVQGPVDKAVAIRRVVTLFQSKGWDNPQVVALGDGPNDRSMLEAADVAVVVRDHLGRHLELRRDQETIFTRNKGPAGWSEAIFQLFGSENVNGT
ncbi:MAG: HAD-IIB family hydrolase [Pseudomonadota bacterium]